MNKILRITHKDFSKKIKDNWRGLSEKEALKLLKEHGKNQLVSRKKRSPLLKFFSYFKNPLILILFVAAILSGILGEEKSAVIIVVIILFSTALNFYQEEKSSREAEKLQEKLSLTATVVRGHVKREIKVSFIVPGDIVFLSAGDIVPADGIIIEADDLFINESVLTGESFPVEKVLEKSARDPAQYMASAGTNVISGSGYLKITATGRKTSFGKIADNIQGDRGPDIFERGVTSFGYLIAKSAIFIVLAVFFIITFKPLFTQGTLNYGALVESFLFALAIAVGLTPELLPMIMSINMATGSIRMAKKGVIVKRLNAIPDFGSIDLLCTDKTGTLTEDKITLVKYLDVYGKTSEDVLLRTYINSSLQTGLKNPLDAAILDFKHLSLHGYVKLDEIPYDFHRKRLSIIAKKDGDCELITKGQPEEIIKICSHYLKGEIRGKITPDFLRGFNEVYHSLSNAGFRTLAVCHRPIPEKSSPYSVQDEADMTLLGLVGFYDPPKRTAAKAFATLASFGVEVKIITGDNELVTQRICQELALPVKGTMTGDEIASLTEDELAVRAENVTIFARFSPEQKSRVIAALRSHHHTVGYLGDGINDAPSLKAADVGISVSNATDVSKEAADIILSHKSLAELGDGIIEGRKTFGNTMKYLMMGASSNFGNSFSLIAAAIYLPFLPILPFQVLLNNFLYDLSQVTIPSDRVDEEYLQKPKHWDVKFMRHFMIVFGLLSSLFDVITFYIFYSWFHLSPAAFQTGWFIESVATQTLVIYMIRTKKFFLSSRPSAYLIATTLAVVILVFYLPYSLFGRYFGFQPLSSKVLAAILFLVVMYLITVEAAKHVFYKMINKV